MNAETWASIGVSAVTGMSGVWAVRAARRTKRQENRDDFTAVTEQQGKAIERLEKRTDVLQTRADNAEARADKADSRLEGAMAAIGFLTGRVRGLSTYIRSAGLEPPAAPPIPDKAREFIHHDV